MNFDIHIPDKSLSEKMSRRQLLPQDEAVAR